VDAWDARSDVVVIDAIRSGRDVGEITVVHVGDDPLPAQPGAGGSHGFGVAEAVELSRALGRLPERLVVVGIEAADFTQGAELTPEVGDAIEVATEVVVELLPDSEVL
jgi:hydrogenase maturation protease